MDNKIDKLKNNKLLYYGILAGIILFFGIIIFLILTSGRKLVCTKESEYSGVKERETVTFKFKKDVPSVVRKVEYDYTTDASTTAEELKSQVDKLNEDKKNNENKKYEINATIKDKVITLTQSFTSEQYKESFKSSIDQMEDKSINGYKSYYENLKYTCK